jgi:hypothetical protein
MDLKGIRSEGMDSSGLGWAPVTGSCEHSNEALQSKNARNFLTLLNECLHFKNILFNRVH